MPNNRLRLLAGLYRRARERGVSIFRVVQEALHRALYTTSNDEWIDRVRGRERRMDEDVDVPALLDDVRDDFGA